MTDLRALTIKRPWSTLIAAGLKDVENRTWSTAYRGPLLIHAGQGWDADAGLFAASLGWWWPCCGVKAAHPQGIVAVADLVGVCPGRPCGCGPWAVDGQRHWLLGDVRALAVPVPVGGALGLWWPDPQVVAAMFDQVDGGAR